MQTFSKLSLVILVAVLTIFSSCNGKFGQNFNLFPVSKDKELGLQVSQEIAQDKKQFPILSETQYREVYSYVRGITNQLLKTSVVKYKDEFAWQVKIIDDPKTLNAFATPGGYLYVYTGLIMYLDSEDQLAGVMGHEIGHSDLRHSTKQMTKSLGPQILLSAVLGQESALAQVMGSLVSMKFGRTHESQSDEFSVKCLCKTDYNAAGAAGFFEKIQQEGGGGAPPEFMSTHPNPANRVASIKKKAKEMGCRGTKTNRTEYNRIKNLLKGGR